MTDLRPKSRGRSGSWRPGSDPPPLRDFLGTQPSEEVIGMRLIDECRLRGRGKHPELQRLYHIPNGGQRGKAVAGKLKAQGTRPSVPDYCLPVARRGYHGLYIELKRHDGQLTPDQRLELEQLNAAGYLAVCAWGWSAAIDMLLWYLGEGDAPPPWQWPTA